MSMSNNFVFSAITLKRLPHTTISELNYGTCRLPSVDCFIACATSFLVHEIDPTTKSQAAPDALTILMLLQVLPPFCLHCISLHRDHPVVVLRTAYILSVLNVCIAILMKCCLPFSLANSSATYFLYSCTSRVKVFHPFFDRRHHHPLTEAASSSYQTSAISFACIPSFVFTIYYGGCYY